MPFTKSLGPCAKPLFFTIFAASLSSCFTPSKTNEPSPVVQDVRDLRYLALGDSITFGDNSFVPYLPSRRSDPEAFVSYATILGKESFDGKYINLACPGESSGSFLDENAADNGCHKNFGKKIKLKYFYEGAQAAAMTTLIKTNPRLELISITLGGNDFFMMYKECIKKHSLHKRALLDCVDQNSAVYGDRFIENMRTIVRQAKAAGFRGKFALLNGYALDYRDERAMQNTRTSNAKIKSMLEMEGVSVIDVFTVFEAKAKEKGGDLCASGLMIRNPLPLVPAAIRCDVHPSESGARLLAETVMGKKG